MSCFPAEFPVPTLADTLAGAEDRSMIVSWCQKLDSILGGGFSLGTVNEITGLPGTGRTTLLLQLAVNTSFAREIGGVGGRSLILSCGHRHSALRLEMMAKAASAHSKRAGHAQPVEDFTNNIDVQQCVTYQELLETLRGLKGTPYAFVGVDGFTWPLRRDLAAVELGLGEPMGPIGRNQAVWALGEALMDIADSDTCVAVVTDVSTHFAEGAAFMAPALPPRWTHTAHTRIHLLAPNIAATRLSSTYAERAEAGRVVLRGMTVTRRPEDGVHPTTLPFTIRNGGIRDVPRRE